MSENSSDVYKVARGLRAQMDNTASLDAERRAAATLADVAETLQK